MRFAGFGIRLLLFASLLLVLMHPAWAEKKFCDDYPPGHYEAGSGTCGGKFNVCRWIDYRSPGCFCPEYCESGDGECGGTSYQACSAFNDNEQACGAVGCRFYPKTPCASVLGSCNLAGTPPTDCCTGMNLVCSSSSGPGTCMIDFGKPCYSDDKCLGLKCQGATEDGPGTCCAQDGQYCGAGPCCSADKICRYTSPTFGYLCLSCASAGAECYKDSDCCAGMSCPHNPGAAGNCVAPNQPPAKPGRPEITANPSIPPDSTTRMGEITCSAGCPPDPRPLDPETGAQATITYQWYQNGNPLGSPVAQATLDCGSAICARGSSITLKTLACDAAGACSYSDASGAISILANLPPSRPAGPAITASSATDGTLFCLSGCPPPVLPTDPEEDHVEIIYQWHKNGAVLAGEVSAQLDCATVGCAEGDRLSLSSKACDDGSPSACSEEAPSNEARIYGTQPPAPVSMDMSYIALALGSAIGVLSLAYMAGRLFGAPQLQAIVQDELLQVIATGFVALSLVGLQAAMDDYGSRMATASGETGTVTVQEAAKKTLDSTAAKTEGLLSGANGIAAASVQLGKEASRGIFCNFLGVGFTLINCSQFNAFRGGLTVASFAAMTALADVYAQQFLLSLIAHSGFQFLLPLGLFLRCFRASRRAGGALIAIGFGFYAVYPATIVATEKLLHGHNPDSPAPVPQLTDKYCDPRVTNEAEALGRFTAYSNQLTDFNLMFNLTYFVMVRVIFMSILHLIITLAFIRSFAHLIGSDIDVSALARIS